MRIIKVGMVIFDRLFNPQPEAQAFHACAVASGSGLNVVLILAACFFAGIAQAQEDEQEAEAIRRFRAYAPQAAEKYELKTAGEDARMLVLRKESLLRWTNPLTANRAHGELFLWTDRGRPAAVLSMYEFTDPAGKVHEHHEWCSLAEGPIQASGPREWAPAAAGIDLKPVPDAPPPADTPVRRLRQMRDIGAGFTAEKTTRQGETRMLRLLSQPTYRYEAGESRSEPPTMDAGLFALVEATDPEVFLCLETRLVEGKAAWHYGLARMNSLRLAASYQGRQVWLAEALLPRDTYDRQDQPYTALMIK